MTTTVHSDRGHDSRTFTFSCSINLAVLILALREFGGFESCSAIVDEAVGSLSSKECEQDFIAFFRTTSFALQRDIRGRVQHHIRLSPEMAQSRLLAMHCTLSARGRSELLT
jgi:hypothetical protein